MSEIDIKNFYKATVERKEFNSDFWNEVKKISTEGELKAFIEEKVQPVAKKMGYDFSIKDLLNYEKQMERKISEQQLETVSGGVSAKNLALGGIFSLMALGAGIVGTTNSASAELTTQDVAKSTEIMETAIAEEFENPKILPIQDEKEIEEAKKDKETSQTNVDKSVNKKDVKIQATKSWYGNWLYLTTDSNSTEVLNLTRSMLESFLKEAGFSSIYEIQAIQARNAKGEILDVKLDKDLGKLFSESKEIPGKLWGIWGKVNTKKDISDADAEQTVVETPGSGTEQSTIGPSDLRDEQVVSDVSDLETAKAATDVDPKEVFETRKLTDGQQLYAYEALNLQEAYALLKSGVVENVRFCGNITKIETKNGSRLYSEDSGDDFTKLLCMLYPSPAGTLNTNTGYKGKDSFAKYGGMSPELAAKFFAILEDYRNKKVEIPKKFKDITLKETRGEDNLRYINPEFKNALAWLKDKGLLTAEGFEKVKAVEDAIKRTEKLKEDLDSAKLKIECIAGIPDIARIPDIDAKAVVDAYFSEQEEELKKEPETNEAKLKIIEGLKNLKISVLRSAKKQLNARREECKRILKELNSTAKSIESSGISEKAKFLMHFINTMKKAADLEVTDGSSYPKYLTEHILMSYMCQTLNNSEDVRELYQKIAEQLSQNETNKAPIPEEEKETTAIKIALKKEEIAKLNDIIKAAEIQELSPYKSATQSNDTIPQIGSLETNGKVQIQADTFSDCADIAARHVINLLTFANEQNWDSILKGANVRELNAKLKEVVDAIGSKSQVKFYDLKTRLQMFFLYQRGFIESVDNEEDREYRSKNGADDVTPLARTLWEYVICNMNEENLKNGLDKDKGLYPIVYVNGKNHEIETGYINMLKLMWNMAKALDLESEALSSAKDKINALSERVKYDSTVFEEALSSIFSLFYTGGEIEFTLSDCEYENNEITGDITVDITKDDQNLNFTICHDSGHGETTYNPVNFNVYKYLEKYCQDDESKLVVLEKLKKDLNLNSKEEDLLEKIIKGLNETLSDFEKLLLRSFINDPFIKERITPPVGFYGTFSEEELTLGDVFRNTALYEKYKTLSASMDLQDEETNVIRINEVLDIDIMRVAKKIVVKQIIKGEDGKQRKTKMDLCKIIYDKYLKCCESKTDNYPKINDMIYFCKFGEIEQTYFNKECKEEQKNISFDVIKTSEKDEVCLLIKSIPENGELIIPSTVYDKGGTEYKVTRISKYSNTIFENLKMIKFTGNFDNLTIEQLTFCKCPNLKTFKIQGDVKNLTINSGAFTIDKIFETFTIQGNVENLTMENKAFHFCEALRTFAIQGDVKNLTMKNGVFYLCESLKNFTIQGNVGNLIMENEAFYRCEVLKNLTIRGNVENLNLGSEIVYGSSKAKIFFPENLKNKIPENFADKNKIIFYDITDDDTLHLKVNEAVSEISLDKETLETLGGNFQNLQAKNLNEEIVEMTMI